MSKYTRPHVEAMPPGDRTAAYFHDATKDGKLPLTAQQAFTDNPWRAVTDWMRNLPERRLHHPAR